MDEVFVADGAKVVIAGRRQFSKRTSNASAFSDVTPGWVHEAEGRRGRRVRKSRQKEAAGAADAGVMQIEWIERGV